MRKAVAEAKVGQSRAAAGWSTTMEITTASLELAPNAFQVHAIALAEGTEICWVGLSEVEVEEP